MINLWNSESSIKMDELLLIDFISKQLISDTLFSPTLEGSLSLKTIRNDLYGSAVKTLLIKKSNDLSTEKPAAFCLNTLEKVLTLPNISPDDLQYILNRSRFDAQNGSPSLQTLAHSNFPSHAVIFLPHTASLALGCVTDWKVNIQKAFEGKVISVDYLPNEWDSLQLLKKAINETALEQINGIFMRYRGLYIFGDNLKIAYANTKKITDQAQQYLNEHKVMIKSEEKFAVINNHPQRETRAKLRKQLSDTLGKPMLMQTWGEVNDELPILSNLFAKTFSSDTSSQLLKNPTLGFSFTGGTPSQLNLNRDILEQNQMLLKLATQIGSLEPLTREVSHTSLMELSNEPFSGEIALVTGAASGIGKGVVLSLIARGAMVIALDIQENILTLTDSPNYLGFVCDLNDETAICQIFETIVERFGGLDMLVLNAGVFPTSCNIDSLSIEHWQKVMRINVDANVILLREAFPLLKEAPRYGRVVINASRNVPAPGPSAAAYSSSKAALTQLGRVAALEWGKAGVRVNIIHPHAVFDTGIWTEEVLQTRAAKYGVTVEEYKTNNVLGVELTSHDVGELVAEICGPAFSKITGAQIPVDGGSDRVI